MISLFPSFPTSPSSARIYIRTAREFSGRERHYTATLRCTIMYQDVHSAE